MNKTIGLPPKELLTALAIQSDDDWDAIIVGDGSGSKYGWGGGWASILFDRESGERKLFYGSVNNTTINVAELSAFIYPMLWYVNKAGSELQTKIRALTQPGVAYRPVKVHFVTDCEIIAKQGNHDAYRGVNIALWRMLDTFYSLGYDLPWHWNERENLSANCICDYISKEMRKATASILLPNICDDEWLLAQWKEITADKANQTATD